VGRAQVLFGFTSTVRWQLPVLGARGAVAHMLALSFPIPPLIPRPALSWSVEGLHPETPKILRYCAHELGARLCGIEMNLNKLQK
jgi:hypothetical protein